MSTLWMLIILLAVIKLPLIALMLWMPFREEVRQSKREAETSDSAPDEDDGGSKIALGDPREPHPHKPLRGPSGPRRDPHGAPAPPSPARVRTPVTSVQRVRP